MKKCLFSLIIENLRFYKPTNKTTNELQSPLDISDYFLFPQIYYCQK